MTGRELHPLDPLTAAEYRRTVELLRGYGALTDTCRFASITLDEPPKAQLQAPHSGSAPARRSLSVFWDRLDNLTKEAVVDLGAGAVVSVVAVPGVTPNFTVDEWHECDHAMKAEPRVVEALAQRGITDLSLVVIDVWTYGRALMPTQWADRRLGWADIWLRSSFFGNPYANPVSGLKLIVDMNTMELLDLDQSAHPAPPAPVMGEYEPDLVPGQTLRANITPLHISQPEGVSFQLDGNELRWQNWSLRVGFNYREGLVLHQVGYDDAGVHRDIAHRLSLAEMIVPYRDPGFDHARRTAYDIGEWGLGHMTTSLALGCDCLGEIRYLDATLADNSKGEPYDDRRTRSASTRRTTPCCGSTWTPTVVRRCVGCAGWWSRRTLPWRTTST